MRSRAVLEGIGHYRRDWLLPGVVVGMLRLSDAMIVVLASLVAYITRFRDFDDLGTFQVYGCVIAVLLTTNIFQLAGLYDFSRLNNLYTQTPRILGCWALVMIGLLALGFLTKVPFVAASRLWVAMWFGYGFVGLFATRILLRHQIRRWQQAGRLARHVAIVGTGPHGKRLIEHMTGRAQAERIVGVFTDLNHDANGIASVGGCPVLGDIGDLVETARRSRIDQVIVALPCSAEQRILDLMKTLRSLPIDVRLCPDMIGFHLSDRSVSHVGGVPMLNVFEKPLTGWGLILKGLEDRVLAGLILFLISPLLLFIAAAIKLDSRGPVLFKQKRYGFNNEVIEVLKFRSMYTDRCCSIDSHVPQATRDDPRVTRVGRFLRRTSLDELPQFMNVLTGNMSIVGPRPHAVAHNEHYAGVIDQYLGRHRVKPGITGWAQVNGLRGETETLEKMEQRVRYDLYYIDNWSLLFDFRIIFRTLFVGFSGPNAY